MTESVGPHTVRASDAEREEFARIVREAVGEGRLTLDEGEERLAKIYAAQFREQLPTLIRDLPNDQDAAGARPEGAGAGQSGDWGGPPWGGPWRGGPGPWGGHGRPGRGHRGRYGPEAWGPPGTADRGPGHGRRGALWRHAAFTAVVAAVLIGIWAITASHFFWPAIPLVFLSLGLVRHARWHAYSTRR